MIDALYYDGLSATAHPVTLTFSPQSLTLNHGGALRSIPRAQLALGEPFARAGLALALPGGGRIEVHSGREELLALLNYRPGRIERLQAHWPGAFAGMLAMLCALWFGYHHGIPAATEHLAEAMPVDVELSIGAAAETALTDKGLLVPSRLSDERLAELQALFKRLQPAAPRLPLRLVVSSAPAIRANAFALPNGTIVLADELVRLAMGADNQWDREAERMVAGVLAHEIAHVEQRHNVRVLARSSLLLGGSWALFGDFSAVAAGLPALVAQMSYSRDMETEADAYAVALLRKNGYSAGDLADLFELLDQYVRSKGLNAEDELPRWMRDSLSYLGSHPAMDERVSTLRDMQDEEDPVE